MQRFKTADRQFIISAFDLQDVITGNLNRLHSNLLYSSFSGPIYSSHQINHYGLCQVPEAQKYIARDTCCQEEK